MKTKGVRGDLIDRIAEIHRGHDCQTWHVLLEDSADSAVRQVEYREWTERRGTIQLVPGGHPFRADETGLQPEWFEAGDYAGGYVCIVCDELIVAYDHRSEALRGQCEGR